MFIASQRSDNVVRSYPSCQKTRTARSSASSMSNLRGRPIGNSVPLGTKILDLAKEYPMPTVQAQSLTDREAEQIERANASSATPVVFVHGLWLLPTGWE